MRKITNLDRRESLQMHAREALLQTAQQIKVVIKRQIRMQPSDNVEFGDRF